jgi:ADP-ribose pyrophosphatase
MHSVAVIALNDAGEILLQREYSYPPNEILWQLPGGSMTEGEDPVEAARRELSEESGLTARKCKILGHYYTNNRRSDERQYVVLCIDLASRLSKADPEEFIESQWVPVDKLDDMMASGEFENAYLLAALNLWRAVRS